MRKSLREVMKKAVHAYPHRARRDWVLDWPGQVVIAGSAIHWTAEAAKVLKLSFLFGRDLSYTHHKVLSVNSDSPD